jgi:hypothetical protein
MSRIRVSHAIATAAAALFSSAGAYAATTGTFLDRVNATDVRVANWNVYNTSILTTRAAKFDRIADAVDADIWCFQELYNSTVAQTTALMNSVRPLDNANGWYVYRNGEHQIASKFPLTLTSTGPIPTGQRGISQALVDLPDGRFNRDLYLMNCHYICCGGTTNDPGRQRQSDAQVNWMRDARTPGGSINLVPGTPMAVLGDLNIVGGPQPLDTLLDGNIQNELTYGADSPPDWDGSNNADANPLHNNVGPENWTWRNDNDIFAPGRLDYVTWTDSVLSSPKRFALSTFSMTPAERAAAGLQQFDTCLDDIGANYDHLPLIIDFAANAGQWGHDGDGNWSASAKWIGPVPQGANEKANFLGVATEHRTITLDSNRTVGALTMDNVHGYTISPSGGAMITLANSHQSFAPAINAAGGGAHAINADIAWATTSQVNVAAGTILSLNGALINDPTFTQTLNFGVSGMLNINGTPQHAEPYSLQLNVSGGGETRFNSTVDMRSISRTSMNVSGAGTVASFAASNRIQLLTINPGATVSVASGSGAVLYAEQITFTATPGGKIDVADGKFAVNQNYIFIGDQIALAHNGGDWAGQGITSSAAAQTGGLTALAYAPATELLGIAYGSEAMWHGQRVRGSSTLVRYTWAGDANLDGELNGDDYFAIDSHILQSGAVFGYHNGDFDYNDVIDGDDYFIIDSNILYAQSAGPLARLSAVPEPAAAMIAAPLSLFMSRRRRGAKTHASIENSAA